MQPATLLITHMMGHPSTHTAHYSEPNEWPSSRPTPAIADGILLATTNNQYQTELVTRFGGACGGNTVPQVVYTVHPSTCGLVHTSTGLHGRHKHTKQSAFNAVCGTACHL